MPVALIAAVTGHVANNLQSKPNDLVDVETLSAAIQIRTGMNPEEANGIAEMVLSYFGFDLQVIDNALEPEDRKVFYLLHDVGILSSEWEETMIPSGRMWRIYYWELNVAQIRKMLIVKKGGVPGENVYDRLPSEAWEHRTTLR